ncbi:hypothetical protein L195_g020840 [Trifolium pratense]|uniref:Uncharacterized protein n=1 Tax=Trifolium pratense TaxID=57577 RepID=A0A2K3N3Q4_TRIPR|nr:hypothetical protein L195_g020840 [Trifolium pratense]
MGIWIAKFHYEFLAAVEGIGMLNILKYSLTSHEPLTNTILTSSSENKDNLPNQSSSAVRVAPCSSGSSKMDIKVVHSKSQKKIIFAEANGDLCYSILV